MYTFRWSSGEPIPARGVTTLLEALGRVGIETVPTRLERAYNAGQTTQVPTGRVVGVTKRVRRKLGYSGMTTTKGESDGQSKLRL